MEELRLIPIRRCAFQRNRWMRSSTAPPKGILAPLRSFARQLVHDSSVSSFLAAHDTHFMTFNLTT